MRFNGRRTGVIALATVLATGAASAQRSVPGLERPPVYTPDYGFGAAVGRTAETAVAPVTTLRDALAVAYSNNPRLLAQRASLRADDNRYPAVRAAYGPSVDIQGSYDYRRDRTEILPGQRTTNRGFTSSASAVFSLPLYTFGRTRSLENRTLAEIALGRDSLRLAEAQVLLDTVTAYVSVERDIAALRVAEENLALLDQQFRDNTERYRVRDITLTDLQQVETRLEFGRAQVLQAQGQLGTSRSEFVRAVGVPPGALAAATPLPLNVGTLDQAIAYADTHNAVVRGAHSREKISRAQIESVRADMGPRLDLRGTAGYGSVSPFTDRLRSTTLTGQVVASMPIIDSGLRRSQLQEAKEQNESDWRLIDSALRDTRQAVTGSWEQMNAAQLSLGNYRVAVEAAERAYEGALQQERAGARTTLDVLDLARDLLNIRTNYIVAQANAYLTRANLLTAMGRLEIGFLLPDIPTYDPTVNFDRVAGRGGIPILRDGLSALDSITTRDVRTDRPIRDPAATVAPTPTVTRLADPAPPPPTPTPTPSR